MNKVYTVTSFDPNQWIKDGGSVYFIDDAGNKDYKKGRRFCLAKQLISESDYLDAFQLNFKEGY